MQASTVSGSNNIIIIMISRNIKNLKYTCTNSFASSMRDLAESAGSSVRVGGDPFEDCSCSRVTDSRSMPILLHYLHLLGHTAL